MFFFLISIPFSIWAYFDNYTALTLARIITTSGDLDYDRAISMLFLNLIAFAQKWLPRICKFQSMFLM